MPSLLRAIHTEAPGVQVEVVSYSRSAISDLADGHYDALVANAALRSDELRATRLGKWPWAVYGRTGHPAFADWSLTSWSAHPHLQVRPTILDGPGPTDRKIKELGLHRVVQAVVPHFSMAAPILAKTDLLLTVPSVTMGDTADVYRLDHRDPPFDLPPMTLSLFRSAAEGDEPGVRWFLERVSALFDQPAPPAGDRPRSQAAGVRQ